ncbi:c-type cytochrome [Pseudoduganella namucuonensis]|nr:cytochrome c family protein [Pseudoduganella namucuonensis]
MNIPFLVLAAWMMPAAWAAGDAEAGRAAFARCAGCHQVGPSARSVFGPQLNGIVGRCAGSDAGYKYSEAMRKSGIVWSDQTLAAFLRAPGDVVPGTRMRFWGIGDERQVADILAYLRTHR